MDEPPLQEVLDRLSKVRHDLKWDILKSELEILFELYEVPEIAQRIKQKYGFDANIAAYKYRFKKWGWHKNISTARKDQALKLIEDRAVLGKRSIVAFEGKDIDKGKLKRRKAELDKSQNSNTTKNTTDESFCSIDLLGGFLPFGRRLFINWSMPFGVRMSSTRQPSGSPFASPAPTMSTVFDIRTPSDTYHSPDSSRDMNNAPSPLSSVIIHGGLSARILHGDFNHLINHLTISEKRTMSLWMYQFWCFAFRSAKHWTGDYDSFPVSASIPITANSRADLSLSNSPQNSESTIAASSPTASIHTRVPRPTDLCNWSIHVSPDAYFYDGADQQPMQDNPQSSTQRAPAFNTYLHNAIVENGFSEQKSNELPLAIPKIFAAASNTKTMLFEEALAFAIIGRNLDLVRSTLIEIKVANYQLRDVHPLHIATTYLDGGRTCCNILGLLCFSLGRVLSPANSFLVNEYGHTAFDNLMLTILRNHSTASLRSINEMLKDNSWVGIEVDICGRWDAESEAFRDLIALGGTSIPSSWKHKFCHTAAQAVVHCLTMLDEGLGSVPSGTLFDRLCTHCGMTLTLTPLHTLVSTAFLLANHARPEEDLFGMIACFLSLLALGHDPSVTANISAAAFADHIYDADSCRHRKMTPLDLMQELHRLIKRPWSSKLEVGWNLLSEIASLATQTSLSRFDDWSQAADHHTGRESLDYTPDCIFECDRGGSPAFNPASPLGHIWATIQMELLNYRRLNEGDSWTSNNFNMQRLLWSLTTKMKFASGYMENGMLQPHCCGGHFTEEAFVDRQTVSRGYHSNMDCWARTSFIGDPYDERYYDE